MRGGDRSAVHVGTPTGRDHELAVAGSDDLRGRHRCAGDQLAVAAVGDACFGKRTAPLVGAAERVERPAGCIATRERGGGDRHGRHDGDDAAECAKGHGSPLSPLRGDWIVGRYLPR